MNKKRMERLTYIFILLISVAISMGLILYSLKQNINLFYTPTQALETTLPTHQIFRLGGQVKPNSVYREKDSLNIHFVLTDLHKEITVTFTGIPPDLFREGSGAIAEGHWDKQREQFIALKILAKHDEKYMPKAMYKKRS